MASSLKLSELWQRMGYRVIVCCMGTDSSVENVSETLVIHRRKDFFLPDPWNYGISLGFAGYVRRLAAKENPDFVVCNKILFWTSFALLSLRLRGKKVILLTDALVGMTWWPRRTLPRIAAALYAWTFGWLIMAAASHIVFFHPQPESLLSKLGVSQKSRVIPTGINSTLFAAGERTPNKVRVTYIGRLESIKGVDDFLEAAVPLKDQYPNMHLQVVGWHKDNHPLVKQFEREVSFTGLSHDVAGVLSTTDIFVLPSHSEGLSNALMEAMASGCACIATEVGGNSFLIQNGVSGFLYPAGDREALAAHIRRLLDDASKRKDLGLKARTRIEEMFDWSIVSKKYQALFTQS